MDRFSGIGFAAEHAERMRGEWGQNMPGQALMRVRERLRGQGGTEG